MDWESRTWVCAGVYWHAWPHWYRAHQSSCSLHKRQFKTTKFLEFSRADCPFISEFKLLEENGKFTSRYSVRLFTPMIRYRSLTVGIRRSGCRRRYEIAGGVMCYDNRWKLRRLAVVCVRWGRSGQENTVRTVPESKHISTENQNHFCHITCTVLLMSGLLLT